MDDRTQEALRALTEGPAEQRRALVALVRGAIADWDGLHDTALAGGGDDVRLQELSARATEISAYGWAAGMLAVLLARQPATTLGEALDACAAAPEHDERMGELECPCCGWVAASGEMWDGDALLCGCAGLVSVDRETLPYVAMSDDPCPTSARCHEGAAELDQDDKNDPPAHQVKTCGECARCERGPASWYCTKSDRGTVVPVAAPPSWCPGPEPRKT